MNIRELTPERVIASSPVIIIGGETERGYHVNFVTENISRLGYSIPEIVLEEPSFKAIMHPGDRERVEREFKQAADRGDDSALFKYRIRTREGEVRWIEDRTVFYKDSVGRNFAYQSGLLDVTERKTAELRKAGAEIRLERLLKTAQVSMWEYSPLSNLVSGSHYGPIFRLLDESWQISLETFFNVHLESPENAPAKEEWRRFMAGEIPLLDVECKVAAEGGGLGWVSFKAFPIRDGKGRISKVRGLTLDITELKKAELEGEVRNRRLALINSISLAFLEERDSKVLLERILTAACELAGTKHGLLSVYREEEGVFFGFFGTGLYAPLIDEKIPARQGAFWEVMRSHGRVIIRDYQAYEERRRDPMFQDVRTLIALPFFQGEVFRGILAIAFTEEDPRIDGDLPDSLEILAASAATALKNAELYEEALNKLAERKKAQEDLRFHGQLARAAAEGGSFLVSMDSHEEALLFALKGLGEATGALGASLYRIVEDEEGRTVANLLARHHVPDMGRGLPFPVSSLTREGAREEIHAALLRGETYLGLIGEVVDWAGTTGRWPLWCVGVPVFSQSVLWGFLALSFEKKSLAERTLKEDAIKTAAHNMAASVIRWESEKEVLTAYEKLTGTFSDAIRTLGQIVGRKDPYTTLHQERVSLLAFRAGIIMGFDEKRLEAIRIAGLVHDVGKVEIPSEILSKPGRLSKLEFDLIRTHAESGYHILKEIDFPWPVAEITRQHHERLDGSGYPRGLKGDDIMKEARILAVADVVEAMASHRPYRPSLGMEAAMDEIESRSGVLYDPDAVAACIKAIERDPEIISNQ
ncbi:MAG: HD domain-containing phosphohydrolase [Aminivibrio sp.]|jgi:PAS domain S-box-containing protein